MVRGKREMMEGKNCIKATTTRTDGQDKAESCKAGDAWKKGELSGRRSGLWGFVCLLSLHCYEKKLSSVHSFGSRSVGDLFHT